MTAPDSENGSPLKIKTSSFPAMIAGLVIVGITFAGFGGWAATAELASAVITSGQLKLDSNRQAVEHLDGGILRELMVRDGDTVAAGQVIAKLDPVQAEARHGLVEGNVDNVLAAMARLKAERDGKKRIAFPPELMERKTDPVIADLMKTQEALFKSRRAAGQGQVALIRARIRQFHEEIEGLKAQTASRDEQYRLIQKELEGVRELAEKGYAPKTRVLALERQAAGLEGERGQLIASVSQTQRAINEAELEIKQITQDGRRTIQTELSEREAELRGLKEQMASAAFTLENIEIRAPANGVVVNLDVHTIGDVIEPGQRIMEIVPADDPLVIEAPIKLTDIEALEPGLRAQVQLSAFNPRTTPRLWGEVSYISADSIEPGQAGGEPFYLVRIRVPEDEVAKLEGKPLAPGMPADLFINTGTRTPLSYLIQPLSESVERAWREN